MSNETALEKLMILIVSEQIRTRGFTERMDAVLEFAKEAEKEIDELRQVLGEVEGLISDVEGKIFIDDYGNYCADATNEDDPLVSINKSLELIREQLEDKNE